MLSRIKKLPRWAIIIISIVSMFCLCMLVIIVIPTKEDNPATTKNEPLAAIATTESTKPLIAAKFTETVSPSATITNSPEPTLTNTATVEPTSTSTFTPSPTPLTAQELTATGVAATSTARSVSIAQTKEARSLAATQTQEVYSKAATATREAKIATATFIAQYKNIYWKDLSTYPDKHKGEKVIVRGRVFNINSDTEFQIFFAGTYEAAYIVMREAYSDLYEDQAVTIYGEVEGENCGTNAFGGEVCQPLIIGDWFTRP